MSQEISLPKGVKLRICFYSSGLQINPTIDLDNQSIGGSETALYHMAIELAKRGHIVEVYANVTKSGKFQGVLWNPSQVLPQMLASSLNYDVFISHRFQHQIATLMRQFRHNLGYRVFWNHDMPSNDENWNKQLLLNCDRMMLLSDFHIQAYEMVLPELKDRLVYKTRNGLNLKMLDSHKSDEKGNRLNFIYGSRPERGLRILLQSIWGEIKANYPEARLFVTSYNMNMDMNSVPDYYKETYKQVHTAIAGDESIISMGALTKAQWYKALSECTAVLYPCQFPEISCILAKEAQYLGVPIVSTKDYALSETIAFHDTLIDYDPYSEDYSRSFIETTFRLLEDKDFYEKAVKTGQDHITKNDDWAAIAKEWEEEFLTVFTERSNKNPRGIVEALYDKDDLMTVKTYAENVYKDKALLDEVNEKLDKAFQTQGVKEPLHADKKVIVNRFVTMENHANTHQPEPSLVLDIGCGYGELIAYYLDNHPTAKAICIDLDTSYAKEYCKKYCAKFEDITFIDLNLYDLLNHNLKDNPLSGVKADVILCGEVLEHFEYPGKVVNMLERYCKAKGVLVFSTPHGYWLDFHHLQHITIEDWLTMLEDKDGAKYTNMAAGVNVKGQPRGNWVVSYLKTGKPTHPINYRKKFLTQPPKQKISGYVMTKNNEDSIMACLKSMDGFVDQIILFDTGSTDSTIELANKSGVRGLEVHTSYKWNNDFSEARNEALKVCKNDWILQLDSDEILRNPENLDLYLYAPYFEGYNMIQRNLLLDRQNKDEIPLRLFRNNGSIKYYGKVHEQPLFTMNEPVNPSTLIPNVVIAHTAYFMEQDRRGRLLHRNLAMLVEDMKQYPDREMGKALAMRDLVHLARYEIEALNGVVSRKAYDCYQKVIKMWFKHFKNFKRKTAANVQKHAYGVYQDALKEMGQLNIPVELTGNVPIQVGYSLRGGLGGLSGAVPQEHMFYVCSEEEAQEVFTERVNDLITRCNATQDKLLEPVFTVEKTPMYAGYDIPEELLGIEDSNTLTVLENPEE